MLFISYFELNTDFDPSELAELAQELMSKKLYPTEGVEQIGWYLSTSDYWGVTIYKADSEDAMVRNTNMWRLVKPGIFKLIKVTPAMDAVDLISSLIKLKEDLR